MTCPFYGSGLDGGKGTSLQGIITYVSLVEAFLTTGIKTFDLQKVCLIPPLFPSEAPDC